MRPVAPDCCEALIVVASSLTAFVFKLMPRHPAQVVRELQCVVHSSTVSSSSRTLQASCTSLSWPKFHYQRMRCAWRMFLADRLPAHGVHNTVISRTQARFLTDKLSGHEFELCRPPSPPKTSRVSIGTPASLSRTVSYDECRANHEVLQFVEATKTQANITSRSGVNTFVGAYRHIRVYLHNGGIRSTPEAS
jgi:hypothetical protein